MRLLVVSPRDPGALGLSLAAGLSAAGHTAEVSPAAGLCAGNRALIVARRREREAPLTALLARRVARDARRMESDAVVVIKGRFLRAADVTRLRERTGGPVVNWFPDDPFHPDHRAPELLEALREYDLVLAWSQGLVEALRDLGARPALMPFGYDPRLYSPRPEGHEQRYDAAFVGQWSAERESALRGLAGLRLAISGLGWERALRGTELEAAALPGRRFGRDAAAVYWSSRVGLNLVHPQNRQGHNMRTWELPATQTAMVATRTPDHERLFGDQGAVLVGDDEDLRAAVEGLLADDGRRERVASAGRETVAEGTYDHRAQELVALLGEL